MKTHAMIAPLVFGTAMLASAQTSVPSRPVTLEDVVAEVRALRADMQELQATGVRAQLLVARLQLQEQRIAGIARELAQAEEQLRGVEAARNPFTDRMLQELSKESPKPEEAEFQALLKGHLEKLQNGDPALKERVASLTQSLAEEQARWAAFNAQLEALERELPVLKRK
jgi:chromosome segregation ATPase